MEVNKIYNGTCLEVLRTFPDKSINCVISSPPYWQLRDYGWSGQWGLEPTFQMYLENLWSLMDEIWRVLKDDGTCWINLGDSYMPHNGSRGNKTTAGSDTLRGNDDLIQVAPKTKREMSGVKEKCLLLIPHRFAIGCIDRGWIMRNDIIWAKRNGMPESVTDRFSKKHEYFFFMTKKPDYYFNLDGIRDKHITLVDTYQTKSTKIASADAQSYGSPRARKHRQGYSNAALGAPHQDTNGGFPTLNELGKNPGSVADFWDIPTKPSSKEHYATFNSRLIDKPIIAGCPEGGIICDPFTGTGTTLIRAYQLNRKVVGIEGSSEYYQIAQESLQIERSQLSLFSS